MGTVQTAASGGTDWSEIGVWVTVIIFILGSMASGMKLFESRKTKKAALEAQRLEEVKKKAVEDATAVDPKKLAAEVAGLKVAVLGSAATEWEEAKPGLVGDVRELKEGQKGIRLDLGRLVTSVDGLAAAARNGNG